MAVRPAAASPRVLLLAQHPQRRGAEVFAHQLGAALERAGCATRRLYLYPLAGGPESANAPLPLAAGDAVLGVDRGHAFERLPGLHPRLLGRLRREISVFAPDVVQAHGGRTVKYAAAARALDPGGGWALVYRNIGDPRRWATGLRGAVYRRLVIPQVDGVVGVSEATLAAVRAHYWLAPGVVAEHIPRGVDPSALAPSRPEAEVRAELATPTEAPVLLFVGSLTREKRLDRLLAWAAIARRRHPELRVWVLGSGPLREQLQERAAAPDLAGAVTFAGARERVGDYLAAADLLLLTSDTEGMPGVVLEAGAVGLPVVATAVGGVPECVVDGETGLLVAPCDHEAGGGAVAELLADRERRGAMGLAARRRIAERYQIDAVARRYIDFYAGVLARRRGETAVRAGAPGHDPRGNG